MNLWARIKRLSVFGILRFGWLFLTNPLLIWPTWIATKNTYRLCNELFGKNHHMSNRANAFRHAYWNIDICQKTLKTTKKAQKSALFAEKVTDLYEKATKNDLFDQAMDFHNNQVGRALFLEFSNKNEQEMVTLVRRRAENAQKVAKIEEIEQYHHQLVYISE